MRIRIIIGIVVLSLISTVSIFAALAEPVGVPLDGGLLSILGAAGISYYLVRKRRKSSGKI
jgi:hypothetical protein